MSDNRPLDPTTTFIFSLAPVTEDVEEAPVAPSARDCKTVKAPPVDSVLLIVQRGPSMGARFLFDPEVTDAGRSSKANIFLDDMTVSRKHCQLTVSNGDHIVCGSSSLNDTYVNRECVDLIELHAGGGVQVDKYRPTYQPSTKQA